MATGNESYAVKYAENDSESILIVEDDIDLLDYLHSILSAYYAVSLAGDGQEALEILQNKRFALIVSDIVMPGKNGFELLRVLREEEHNLTPFLFITALAQKQHMLKAFLLGVDGYLTKPFDSEELLVRVKNMVENNRRRRDQFAAPNPNDVLETSDRAQIIGFREKWLKELEKIIGKSISANYLKVPDLAQQMAVSERTLRARVKEYTGLSPSAYVMEIRLHKALDLLESGAYLTIAEVAYKVGLESSSYFTKVFKERFGKSPVEYLRQ